MKLYQQQYEMGLKPSTAAHSGPISVEDPLYYGAMSPVVTPDDKTLMQRCFELARQAVSADSHPFGALLAEEALQVHREFWPLRTA